MKIVIPFLLLFCILSSAALSQNTYTIADTAVANRLFKESNNLFNRRQFDSTVLKIDSVIRIYEPVFGRESKEIAYALFHKSIFVQNQLKKDINEALSLAEEALAIRLKLFGKHNIEVARSYQRIAQIFADREYDQKAISNYEKAIEIRNILGIEDLETAMTYAFCTNVYGRQLQLEKGLTYGNKALAIRIKLLGEDHVLVGDIYNQISLCYFWVYDFMPSIQYMEKAKSIYIKKLGIQHPKIMYLNLSLIDAYVILEDWEKAQFIAYECLKVDKTKTSNSRWDWATALAQPVYYYVERGDSDKAIALGQNALDSLPSSFATQRAFIQTLIAEAYNNLNDYDRSIENFKKAIQMHQSGVGSSKRRLGIYYKYLSNAYQLKGLYNSSIDYSQKALQTYGELYDSSSLWFAEIYFELASCYEKMEQYDSAQYYMQKVLNSRINKYLESSSYISLARLAEKQKQFVSVQNYLDTGLIKLNYTNTNELQKVFLLPELLSNLEAKASFERNWYLATGNINYLKASADSYREAFAALDYQNRSYYTDGAKSDQKNKRYSLYEGAIKTTLLLKSLGGSKKSFTLSEQSKANLLQSQLKEIDALRFSNIPDSLLAQEKKLRLTITAMEKGLQQRVSEGKGETESINLVAWERTDSVRRLYNELKQTFEKNYPNYYRLKYNLKTVDVAEVQQNLLSKDQTLLSYFVGDSSIYAFVIRPDTFAVFDFKKDFPLESWIKQLRDGLYGYHTARVKTEKLYETKADSFAVAAFQLHQKLIAPLRQLLTQEVVIVPDGILGYVPFDVLLTEKPQDALKFEQHRYFGKNHIISYNYSATLWQEMQNKKHKTEPTKNFIGFAPYYNGDTALLSTLFSHDLAMRKGLDSLKYSGEEVFKAQKLMRGDAVLDKKATKYAFESLVGDYRIVHLATHGKANDKIGDYCFLAFTEQKDSVQNELLYVRDIYNLTLNADLVVLSACETGIGELKRGEGIVSLARAFAYAGAKSIVTTLWSVNDKSTMHIMEGFYRQLRKGQPKDHALWQAKMDYLHKAKSETAHPFFWSAFVPVGDMRAVKK